MKKTVTTSNALLLECAVILNQRGEVYGSADKVFGSIAGQWSNFLGKEISKSDTAIMMAQMKIARLAQGIDDQEAKKDTFLDAINYIALAYECEQP